MSVIYSTINLINNKYRLICLHCKANFCLFFNKKDNSAQLPKITAIKSYYL